MNSQNESFFSKIILVVLGISFFAFAFEKAPLMISSLVALGVWLLSGSFYKERSDWQGQPWVVPVLLLIALPWAGLLWAPSPRLGLVSAEKSYYWLFAFMAASVFKSPKTLRLAMKLYLSGIISFSFFIFLNSFDVFPRTYTSNYYLNVIFDRGYITFSLMAVAAICLLAYFFKETDRVYYKSILCISMILLAATITRLPARSGYLALVLLLPWICAVMFGFRKIIPIFIFGLFVVTLLLTSQNVQTRISMVSQEMKRLQTGTDTDLSKTSIAQRFVMWEEAWKIFKNRPVLGAGTAGFQVEANKNRPGFRFSHPHSSYLYILSTYGVLGIILYGWLLVVTLKRACIARKQLSGHVMLSFLTVILIGGLTDTTIMSPATGILLGFIVGIPTELNE